MADLLTPARAQLAYVYRVLVWCMAGEGNIRS